MSAIENGCARCGHPIVRQTNYNKPCSQCLGNNYPWDSLTITFRYSQTIRQLLWQYKFQGDFSAGKALTELFVSQLIKRLNLLEDLPQVLIPVPLHPRKMKKRGFNQSAGFAEALSQKLNIPIRHNLVERIHYDVAQTKLGRIERLRNMSKAFAVRGVVEEYDHVCIVDDVITTEATLRALAKCILKHHKIKRVSIWCLAKNIQMSQ